MIDDSGTHAGSHVPVPLRRNMVAILISAILNLQGVEGQNTRELKL